jgi:acetyl esterase/lipase
MKKTLLLFVSLLMISMSVLAADNARIILWPNGAPGALGKDSKDIPTLQAYVPENANGAAIVIVPGGSYKGLFGPQQEPFAKWLNTQGITVFVLRYRLGSAGYRYPSQLQDALEAIRYVRENASRWKLSTTQIGVMGFSAGGHLVSTLINQPEDGEIPSTDPKSRVSGRPDIAILCYPVISMTTKPHLSSIENLLGTSPSIDLLRRTSSELQVKPGLPPCFVWHTVEDKLVTVDHSLLFATALQQHGVPYELHLYQKGGHGTGLMDTPHPWRDDLIFWLKNQGFLKK